MVLGSVGGADSAASALPVDFSGGLLLHIISDVGIGVQRSGTRDVTDDGREGLYIHPMLQGVGGESVSQIVEPYLFAPRMSQDFAQPMTGGGWGQRGVLFLG